MAHDETDYQAAAREAYDFLRTGQPTQAEMILSNAFKHHSAWCPIHPAHGWPCPVCYAERQAHDEAGTSPPDECARCHKTDFEPSTMAGWACRHCRLWHRGREAHDGASGDDLLRESVDWLRRLMSLIHRGPAEVSDLIRRIEERLGVPDSSGDSGEEDERTANRQATALGPLARVIHSPKTPDEPSAAPGCICGALSAYSHTSRCPARPAPDETGADREFCESCRTLLAPDGSGHQAYCGTLKAPDKPTAPAYQPTHECAAGHRFTRLWGYPACPIVGCGEVGRPLRTSSEVSENAAGKTSGVPSQDGIERALVLIRLIREEAVREDGSLARIFAHAQDARDALGPEWYPERAHDDVGGER